MSASGWVWFIHAIVASAMVMIMLIMQLVVANVMKRIESGPGKMEAVKFLQGRWMPIVDAVIILVGISGVTLAYFLWPMIKATPLMHVKITFAVITLSIAYSNHFYFRYKKKRLAASGENPEKLKKLGKFTGIMEKVGLGFGVLTALLGFFISHVSHV